jgi:glycosyltransferase involved in cell wall biosynthesis
VNLLLHSLSKKICVIIPAYNSYDTVGDVIGGAKQYLSTVVVVDDGSKDGTYLSAKKAGAIVLKHKKNCGKGMALRTGFAYMLENSFNAVITLDADNQHDPSEIPRFLARYQEGEADIIIGSRMHEKDRIPRYRYIPNQVGVTFISWAAGCHFEDTQSGYRLYSSKVIKTIKLTTKGYHTETEILIKAGKKGFKIATIPIKTIYFPLGQEKSYYRPIIDTYLICITFLRSFFW